MPIFTVPSINSDELCGDKIICCSKKNRICGWRGCTTQLSIYNFNDYCFAHMVKATYEVTKREFQYRCGLTFYGRYNEPSTRSLKVIERRVKNEEKKVKGTKQRVRKKDRVRRCSDPRGKAKSSKRKTRRTK